MTTLAKFSEKLKQLPRVVAQRVAAASALALSDLAQASFDEAATPYGVPWPPGVHGQKITLIKSGRMESTLRYVATGTRLRVALTVPYAKFQIGKRLVFPRSSALPRAYVDVLQANVNQAAKAALT